MISENVPHRDFRAGFIVGWQLVCGTNSGIPGTPGQPGTPGTSTPFLEGIKEGLRAAGHKIAKSS